MKKITNRFILASFLIITGCNNPNINTNEKIHSENSSMINKISEENMYFGEVVSISRNNEGVITSLKVLRLNDGKTVDEVVVNPDLASKLDGTFSTKSWKKRVIKYVYKCGESLWKGVSCAWVAIEVTKDVSDFFCWINPWCE